MSEGQTTRTSTSLEVAVAVHLAIFVIGVSWAFGGNADWVRTPISIWGTLGIVLCLVAVVRPRLRVRFSNGTFTWAWPVLGLNFIVGAACMTPGFRFLTNPGGELAMPVHVDWWIPSSARADLSLRELWLFDGIYFSCLNVALAVRHRSVIRVLLAVMVGNALVLSIFGIVQNAVGSTGIYFGLVETPQVHFFASFVYDNHWGAFIVLMVGASIGLIFRYSLGRRGDGFFRGPAFAGVVAAALIAVSVPLSGSRACTLLLAAIAVIAMAKGMPRVTSSLRASGILRAATYAGIAAAVILAAVGTWFVAGDVIEARVAKTKEQVSSMLAQGGIGSRSILYGDTLRMARVRPLFGWGMGTYPAVFVLFNSQESKLDHLPVVYHDAHSDWLQSLAEIGIIGTALIAGAVALPAVAIRRLKPSTISYFLLAGCLLVGAYAWIEFPFGNVAVVLSWWLCYFCAIQYMRLTERSDASPIDT